MKWTVTYKDSAIEEIADLWNRAADRQAVTDASDRIDDLLRRDPEREGDPYNNDRIIIVQPLVAIYSVSPDDRLVTVLHVFLFGS